MNYAYASAEEVPYRYEACKELLVSMIEHAMRETVSKDSQRRREARWWLLSKSWAPWTCRWALSYLVDNPVLTQRLIRRRLYALKLLRPGCIPRMFRVVPN